jgi:D-alanyl-D-alanine carboxypeptidase
VPIVKPWSPALRTRGRLSYLPLVLILGVTVACTTVVSAENAEPSTAATAQAVVATVAPTFSASPTVPPTAAPTLAPSSVPTATASPSPKATTKPIPQAADGPTLDHKTRAKLQRILENQVKNKDVAGLQAAVRLPDGEMWLGSAGNAEFDPDRALDDDDQMAIASVTKTFVAALILQLADEGKIDLDATFGTYFRDAPRKDSATVRQLLSHTSGIYNYWANPRYGQITKAWWANPDAGGLKSRSHEWTYEEMMDLVRSGDFKPGTDFEYSNTNYLILRNVAEAVGGKPIHKQLQERFIEPLGLADTIYQPAQKPRADAAHGHWSWPGGHTDHTKESAYVPFMAAVTIADGAGAMASTAHDLAVWAAALYGGDVLSEHARREMTTFLQPGNYGLGVYPKWYAGNRGIGHRGGIRGYESAMFYFPDSGISVALVSNQGNWGVDVPMEKLVKAVLGEA